MRGVAATSVVAVSVDWSEVWKDLFRQPSQPVTPQALPTDVPVYRSTGAAPYREDRVTTLFASQEDFYLTAEQLVTAQQVLALEQRGQRQMFARMGARLAIGKTYQQEQWEAFGRQLAREQYGATPSSLTANYGMPDVEIARRALLNTQKYAATIPLSVLRDISHTESVYVAGASVQGSVSVVDFETSVENGATDTIHGGLLVDCLEGGDPRRGVGRQWLHQLSILLDAHISQSPTTYNDREFTELLPSAIGIEQDRLDYPSAGDDVVFGIASTKAKRFGEIMCGKLILPGDDEFYAPEQAQQELLLRRIYGTFDGIPAGYFESLTLFRREHDGALPLWGGQLIS